MRWRYGGREVSWRLVYHTDRPPGVSVQRWWWVWSGGTDAERWVGWAECWETSTTHNAAASSQAAGVTRNCNQCRHTGLPFIIIIIKGIYIAQVRKGHECTMSAEMAVWLRNCLCLYSYLHNQLSRQLNRNVFRCLLKVSSETSTGKLFHATGPLMAKLLSP